MARAGTGIRRGRDGNEEDEVGSEVPYRAYYAMERGKQSPEAWEAAMQAEDSTGGAS
jgi:hypothetical protein